ncbi:MAG: pyridoxamine 5'-phosphate oxidase family protein [Promethearchaeota archaeon]
MSYTQAPNMTEEEIEKFLKTKKIARFCSLNKDNTIHATPVWFNYVNKQIIKKLLPKESSFMER